MTLKRTIELLKEYLRINNIIELTNVNKYRLDEINKIRDYFNNEIKEREDIIKKLNKYLVNFDYLDKIFITLSASFGTLSIASYTSVVPLDGTHLVALRGLITKRYSTQERQREELVGVALLCLMRTNRSSLTCCCQFPDSR